MTTQHPQPAFFSLGGSGSADTTGGLHFGVIPTPCEEGSCTFGIGLYTPLRRFVSGPSGVVKGHMLLLPSVDSLAAGGGDGGFNVGTGGGAFSMLSLFSLLPLLVLLLLPLLAFWSGVMAKGANSRS